MAEASIIVAFLAGIVSFLAPCVLPLIPGFLAYLAGSSLEQAKNKRREIFLASLCFVLGLALAFSVLGVLLNTILSNISYDVQTWLSRIGGVFIIFFGLHLVELIKAPFLEREYKINVNTKIKSKYITAFLFGAAFAVGWTPCVGPVLGAILGLAATEPGSAFILLFSYSIGLGIPFLIVGAFTSQAAGSIKKYARILRYVKILFGALLIIIGILVFTQTLNLIASWEFLNRFIV